MSVRTLFLSCVGAIAAVAILAAGLFVAVEWHHYQGAAEARSLAETMGAVLRITEKLTLSRGTQNSVLLADGPATEEARAKVATARRAITDALGAADAALATTRYADRPAAEDALRRLGADLAALFAELDAAYRVPKAARDGNTVKSFVPRMMAFGNALNGVANGIERAAASADPVVGRLASIARLSWDMRDAGGRRTTIFTTAIAAGQPLTAAQIEAAASFTGEARHAWARLEATASQIDDAPRLVASMKNVQAVFFGEGDALLADLTAKGRTGGHYGMSFDDAWGRLVGSTQAALGVRDAALLEAVERADATRADAFLRLSLAVGGLILVVVTAAGASTLLTWRVMTPLAGLIQVMARLAAGEHTIAVPGTDRHDEIGGMAQAVEVFKTGLIDADRLAAARAVEEQSRRRRTDVIERLIGDFERMSASVLGAVGTASGALDRTAQGMLATAHRTNAEAQEACAAAEHTTLNVQTVAAAAEEMTSAIGEIGRQIVRSAEITGNAVAEADRTNGLVRSLEEAVTRIGDVVQFITSIASQTNLLALNATIEAARAGEAGKGFAVVATEVKALANQTAKATDDIAAQINAIQAATGQAVSAIGGIGGTIAAVSDIASSIAAAMEQQSAATSEISRNVQHAAEGTQRVSGSIGAVTEAARQTDGAAADVLQAAGELSRQAEVLRGGVERFLAAIKAA